MVGRTYVPGALVAAASLRALGTRHDTVCMVTPDVPEDSREQLRRVFTAVVEVPYIQRPVQRFDSAHQAARYSGWLDRAFTKWNCLTLVDYDRVVLVDADMVFIAPADELFELCPPAACFSLPYLTPWRPRGGLPNPYIEPGEADMPHGARVSAATVVAALHQPTIVAGGFLVLLEPNAGDFRGLLAMLGPADECYGAGFQTKSGADEASISEFYAGVLGRDWTHIHQRYAAIPWKPGWVSRDVRAYHYLGRKPWDMDPGEFPDLAHWWRVADRLGADYGMAGLFAVGAASKLDLAAAEVRLTADLRAMVVESARRAGCARDQWARAEIDACLERWLLAMANSAAPAVGWARIYRVSVADAPFNIKLAAELAASKGAVRLTRSHADARKLVATMLTRVAARLDRPPRATGSAAEVRASASRAAAAAEAPGLTLTYGAQPVADTQTVPGLAQLIDIAGADATAHMILRYAALSAAGSQWALPRRHVAHLRSEFGIDSEAFASPLNARLIGIPGTRFCSLFPDTDAVFGSIGSFFDADISHGNWVVNPPFIENILAWAARRITIALASRSADAPAQTFFFIGPAWRSAEYYRILSESPHCAASVWLKPSTYYYEDPANNRQLTRAESYYCALTTRIGDPALSQKLEYGLRQIAKCF